MQHRVYFYDSEGYLFSYYNAGTKEYMAKRYCQRVCPEVTPVITYFKQLGETICSYRLNITEPEDITS